MACSIDGGTLVLGGANNDTGGTNIIAGAIQVSQNNALPAGNALVEGATFMAILLGTIVGGLAAKEGNHPAYFSAMIVVLIDRTRVWLSAWLAAWL